MASWSSRSSGSGRTRSCCRSRWPSAASRWRRSAWRPRENWRASSANWPASTRTLAAWASLAAARLADLHEKVRGAEERAAALRRTIADADAGQITKAEVDAALGEFDGVWSRLSPKEQARLMRMLVQRVDYDATKGSISITFHPLGLRSIGQRGATEEAA